MPVENPIATRLDPGEKLLWFGQPKQGVRLQRQDVFLIPFSLMWGGFAIFWEAGVLGFGLFGHSAHHDPANMGVTLFMSLWGIPFVLIGLYIIVGRFFYDAASRRKTFYAVTDRRAIVLKSLWTMNLASYDLYSLGTLNFSEGSDGSGAILFGTPSPMSWASAGGWPSTGRYAVPGFYLLPNAREIFNLIRDAQNSARGSAPR